MVSHPVLAALVLFMVSGICHASETRLVAVSPDSEVRFSTEKKWRPAEEGMTLQAGDLLSTGYRAMAVLQFDGPAFVLLQPMTQLAIEEHVRDKRHVSTRLFLRLGAVRAKVKKKSGTHQEFVVATPTGRTCVEAGEQLVSYAEEFGTRVQVLSGRGEARASRDGVVELACREAAELRRGLARTPAEVYREKAAPDFLPRGSDVAERDAARDFNVLATRPLSDPTTVNTLSEQASLSSAEATLVFRYEVLAGQ
ncbi:MAG: FecR domain-containing protein [Candidatus Riflebacteria bacterium]|nr:FecR domain-containing protein [Candidatus Riflebacteria bacterium]